MPMRRNIFDPLQDIKRELDQVFDRFLGEGFAPSPAQTGEMGMISPNVDVCVEGDTLRIDADLPGVEPEDVECTLKEGVLTIKGERRSKRAGEGDGSRRRERKFGRFERVIELPEGVDEESMEARFDKGVLTITAHMKPGFGRPKRIRIAGKGASQGTGTQQQSAMAQPGSGQRTQSDKPDEGAQTGQQTRPANGQ